MRNELFPESRLGQQGEQLRRKSPSRPGNAALCNACDGVIDVGSPYDYDGFVEYGCALWRARDELLLCLLDTMCWSERDCSSPPETCSWSKYPDDLQTGSVCGAICEQPSQWFSSNPGTFEEKVLSGHPVQTRAGAWHRAWSTLGCILRCYQTNIYSIYWDLVSEYFPETLQFNNEPPQLYFNIATGNWFQYWSDLAESMCSPFLTIPIVWLPGWSDSAITIYNVEGFPLQVRNSSAAWNCCVMYMYWMYMGWRPGPDSWPMSQCLPFGLPGSVRHLNRWQTTSEHAVAVNVDYIAAADEGPGAY
jgi:hypothetical protein